MKSGADAGCGVEGLLTSVATWAAPFKFTTRSAFRASLTESERISARGIGRRCRLSLTFWRVEVGGSTSGAGATGGSVVRASLETRAGSGRWVLTGGDVGERNAYALVSGRSVIVLISAACAATGGATALAAPDNRTNRSAKHPAAMMIAVAKSADPRTVMAPSTLCGVTRDSAADRLTAICARKSCELDRVPSSGSRQFLWARRR